jgi:integrase
VGPSGRERRVAEYKGPFRLRAGGHLYSLLFEAAERAGVELPDRSAFHLLRHTYATWMRRYAGADETALISTGAWRDKKSVARYTHTVVSEDARRAALLPTPKPKVKEV